MRFLLGLGVFWGLVALGIVALLVVKAGEEKGEDGGGGGKSAKPSPLTCPNLGDRARKCRKELLRASGDFVEKATLRAGRSPFTAGGRRLALTAYLDGAISQGTLGRECEAQRTSRAPMIQRLWRELERCWKRPGCEAFARCLSRVAETEEKAGRLPL